MKALKIKMMTLILCSVFSFTAKANNVELVLKDIGTLMETSEVDKFRPVAKAILKHSKAYNIDYKIVLALIMTESTFRQGAVSSTGDLGIGQINYKVWSKEFARLKKNPLNKEKLKTDSDYAIKRTVEILAILKCKKDPLWVAKYHSKTPSLKKAYYQRIANQLNKISQKDRVLASNP